ncbi:MAG: dethiobiotin synthase, partial [Gammaproteobacteria bacterium]|nr:dethiobiotin synthase [Gammaproteobacteria bacterium]
QRLRAQASVPLPYEWVNPYAFEPPVSPHIAAAEAGVRIELAHVERCFAEIARRADVVVVEGIGGWLVPLDEWHTTADMARVLGLPLILVVGVRLGCLNHALLTYEHIQAQGVPLAAWIANVIDAGCVRIPQIIATLERRLPVPLLGVIPFLAAPEPGAVAVCLALDRLVVDKAS